jgi:hypothetical protein
MTEVTVGILRERMCGVGYSEGEWRAAVADPMPLSRLRHDFINPMQLPDEPDRALMDTCCTET